MKVNIESFIITALSCTSRPCAWGHGSMPRDPDNIKKRNYFATYDMARRATFDPRPTEFQRELSPEEVTQMMYHFLQDIQGANREHETIWQKHLFFKYPDYQENDEYLEIVKILCKRFLQQLDDEASKEAGPYEIPGTRGQSTNLNWFVAKALKFSGSDAKRVMNMTPDGLINYYRAKLWGLDGFTSKYTSYGTRMEPKARKAYLKERQKIDATAEIEEPGLYSHCNHSQLAGSFDGIVRSQQKPPRLVELKCPETVKLGHPEKFEKCLSPEQQTRFCLSRQNNGKTKLKDKHKFWYQMQLYMGLLQVKECDFVVWSPKGMHIETINFDKEKFELMATTLKKIHREILVPEYFLQRTPRNLMPIRLIY